MRTPKTTPPPVVKRPEDGVVTQIRRYELITPLFGGGVNPAEADPVTVIRGTEIRGHLRFWWRACRGGQFNGNLRDMKDGEDEIWGASSMSDRPRPSKVQIEVLVDSEGRLDRPFEVVGKPDKGGKPRPKVQPRSGSVVPVYAAFPLQPSQEEADIGMQTKAVRVDVSFTLTVSYPQKYQSDVEAARWAWETFGGLGARTRRGFGALRCTYVDGKPAPVPDANEGKVKAFIQEGLAKYVVDGSWPEHVPHLTRKAQFEVRAANNPLAAWRDLIARLKKFRQARNPGTQPNRPGRSQWPEPDAIRRLTGRRARLHASALSDLDKFPRAAFGLPIIFHFKDHGDPQDATLKGAASERLASPLILRPIACAGNQAVGLVLLLESPRTPPGGLILKGAPNDPPVSASLTPAEAQTITLLGDETDVLQTFLNKF